MDTIYADQTISISDFKTSPAQTVELAEGRPVAVLVHNKPAFYAVPSSLFEKIADILDDFEIAEAVQERLANPQLVDVSLEDL